jgi:hypothetical protein
MGPAIVPSADNPPPQPKESDSVPNRGHSARRPRPRRGR